MTLEISMESKDEVVDNPTKNLSKIQLTDEEITQGYLDLVEYILDDKLDKDDQYEKIKTQEDLKVLSIKVIETAHDFFGSIAKEIIGAEISMPKIVFFENQVISSKCGNQEKSKGPFYCKGDETIYISISELMIIFNSKKITGTGAILFVILHEYGHHFTNFLCTNLEAYIGYISLLNNKKYNISKIDRLMYNNYFNSKEPTKEKNELSVYHELCADYSAGFCFNYMKRKGLIHSDYIQEAFNIAFFIGSDEENPNIKLENMTHPKSSSRGNAFITGFEQGTLSSLPMIDFFDKHLIVTK